MATGEAQGEGRGKPSQRLPPPTQAWPRSLHCMPRRLSGEFKKTYAEQCDIIDSLVDLVGAEFDMPAVLCEDIRRMGAAVHVSRAELQGGEVGSYQPGRELVQIDTTTFHKVGF